jgi:hypothetical protein
MKLAQFNDYALGVIKGDALVDVSAAVADVPRAAPQDLMTTLIGRFDGYRAKIEAAAAKGTAIPLGQVRLRAPVPKPSSIVCPIRDNPLENSLPDHLTNVY